MAEVASSTSNSRKRKLEDDYAQMEAKFPTIEEFMIKARLETYTHDMKKNGWDDVQYLEETVKNIEDFSKLDSFPITRCGHLAKMLTFLKQLVSQ